MKRLVLGLLTAVGCGGGSSVGNVPLDNFGTELGQASCSKIFDCCTDAEIMAQFMGVTIDGQPITTEDQCVSFVAGFFGGFAVTSYKASIMAGRAEYDGDAAGACIDALNDLTCAQYNGHDVSGLIDSGCRPFIIAKVGDGGGCTQDYECTSDNCVGAMVGGSTSTDGMCKPMPTQGQMCDENCADGLYCTFDTSNGMKFCQPLKADGAACQLDSECTSDNCDNASDTCTTKAPTCTGT